MDCIRTEYVRRRGRQGASLTLFPKAPKRKLTMSDHRPTVY